MKKLDQRLLPIFLLVLASFLADQAGKWAAQEFQNNMPVLHAYSFTQAALLFWFFKNVLKEQKEFILASAIVYLTYFIINSIWIESILTFNQTARIIQNVLFLILTIFYFYNYYEKESTLSPEKDAIFWTVVGIFTYYSGTLFTYILSTKILSTSNDTLFGGWIIHNLANTLKNLIFCIALWLGRLR